MDTSSIKGYELREEIGTGGFGAVYRAVQTTIGREVAVKIILPNLASQPDFIRRFEGEAQLVARLEHPHIVPLHDYWRDPDGAYLVMRWLRGGSLRSALQNGPFELRAAALLLDQLAGALSLAHRNNVIHRDIKPGNILLDEDGNAYLTDFGIAKDLNLGSSGTQPDAIMGSLDYISPEQARSEPVTARTDIYSMGVTMYEVISGHHPFQNLSTVERLYKHISDPLPEITTLEPSVLAEVNRVIQKATAKNPDHRYADALAFAADFREATGLNRTPTSVVELLTQREHEILRLIIEGMSNKEIALHLTVTHSTVRWYVNQIYSKLGVRSRVQAIIRARGLNLIGSERPAAVDAALTASNLPEPENPYKGLRAFQAADEQDFFGREELTQKLINHMKGVQRTGSGHESLDNGRFLAVIGPSGSGKSSIVKAGLIPALWRGDLPGSEHWFVADMLPGAHPLDKLEVALIRVAANQSSNLNEQLTRDQRGLLRVADLILPRDDSELVLLIDQFEEVFTLVEEEAERQQFLDLLIAAVTDIRSRVRVIITMRADFYDRPLHYPEFGELVRSHMETVLPLSAKGLERAISGPAQRVGVRFEDGLVSSIVAEMNYQAGVLPLLQYALTELFERRDGRLLTHQAYQDIGGAVGALAKRAEDLYNELTPEDQAAAHQMFLRLVTLGEGVEDTRRRTPRAELMAISDDADLMDEIIDTYASYRLLTLDNELATRTPTVELAHEAMLREWERLRGWLNESRSEIRLQRQLAAMVSDWREAGGDKTFLAQGLRLEQFEKWAKDTTLALTPEERDYLNSSLDERQRQMAAEQERQSREKTLEKRSVRFLRALVGVLLVATLGAFGLVGIAVNQSQIAERSAEISQSLALASAAQSALTEGNTDQAIALAVAANQIDAPPAFAQRLLYESVSAPGTIRRIPCAAQWCFAMDVSPDEHTILAGDDTGGVVLSDIVTGQPIRTFEGHTEPVGWGVAFLPDGQRFLSAGFDDRMLLWDMTSGDIIRRYASPYGDFNKIDISPDGLLVATATEHGIPMIWDIETGEALHELVGHDQDWQIVAVEFSPDGRTLLSGSEDTTMILWDVHTGQLLRRFEGHTNAIVSVHFSPDGQTALSASFDNTMILWDIATGQMIHQFTGHTSWVFDALFSPDGTRILSASRDQTLVLWDVATGDHLRTYLGEAGAALGLRPLADGRQAISGHNSGYMRVWDLEPQDVVSQFGGQSLPADNEGKDDTETLDGDTLTLSNDGRWAATWGGGADTDEVLLWDVETGTLVRRFAGHEGDITAVAFSPDQRHLASAAWDNTLILWDAETGELLRRFMGHSAPVYDMAFSPDGTLLLSGSEDRSMILWDVETGEQIRDIEGFADSVNTVAFSPDGHTLLAGIGTIRAVIKTNEDSSLHLFDAQTGEEIRRLYGHTAPVTVAAFSADGSTILSGSTDATIRLWDVATGSEIRQFYGQATGIWSVAFSPDMQHVVAGSQDGTIMVWDVTTGDEIRRFEGEESMINGVSFSADGEQLVSAANDGTLRVWRLSFALDEIFSWTQANRYIPDLTCSQRALYRIEPLCIANEPA